jgi:branched-subunit amino acid aminotransferase/4-amino-4-deoxychorismate lyase
MKIDQTKNLNALTRQELIERCEYLQWLVNTQDKDIHRQELIQKRLMKIYGIAN